MFYGLASRTILLQAQTLTTKVESYKGWNILTPELSASPKSTQRGQGSGESRLRLGLDIRSERKSTNELLPQATRLHPSLALE